MKKLFLFPCLFFALASIAQTKVTIQGYGTRCATVISNREEAQRHGDLGFQASRDTTNYTSRGGPFRCTRSYLQLDMTSIPAGSVVDWAKLTLYLVAGSGANTALLRRVTTFWDPGTVDWINRPTTSLRGTVKLPASTDAKSYHDIDVWTLVQQMVDSPATSFGFELKLDTEQNERKAGHLGFYSTYLSEPRNYPKLVVEYKAPGLHQKVTTMSVDLNGSSTEMNIYPNPCNKAFNCNIKSASTDNINLRVIDMLGRTVYSQAVNTSNLQLQVNLPASSAGSYFVVLQDKNGGTIVSQQLQVN